MFKKLFIIITAVCFFVPSIVCAELAPQFNKSATNKTDISKNVPTHGKIFKKGEVAEKNVNKNGDVMENNVNKNKNIMENNVNQGGNVMENKAPLMK